MAIKKIKNVRILYTRAKLRALSVEELKAHDLYKEAKVSKKITTKGDIVVAMLGHQKKVTEKLAAKEAKEIEKFEEKAKAEKVISDDKTASKKAVKEHFTKSAVAQKKSLAVFTRKPKVQRRNPMNFK